MFKLCVRSVAISLSVFGFARAGEPPVDGFPLPTGALQRFGNRQMRDLSYSEVISPDGKYLATASAGAVVVWDTKTLSAKRVILKKAGYSRARAMHFLPDSKTIVLAPSRVSDEGVYVRDNKLDLAEAFDIETGLKKFGIPGRPAYYCFIWPAANGKEIVVLPYDGRNNQILFCSAETGKVLKEMPSPFQDGAPWMSGDGETIAYMAPSGGVVVADLRSGKPYFTTTELTTAGIALSHDGQVMVGLFDKTARIYDVRSGKERFSFPHPDEQPNSPLVISADKKTLYFGSGRGHLFRWDLEKNKQIPGLDRHSLWTLSGLALAPDDSILYAMGQNKVISRWDLKTSKQLPRPDGYETIVAMLPDRDGKHLILGDHATQLDRWELATGKQVKRLQGITNGGNNCLAQSADGRWLAVGRVLQDMQIWDLTTDKMVLEIPLIEKPDRYGGDQVQQVGFSPDGKIVYATSPKTGTSAFDRESGKRIWNTPGTKTLAAFDPLGRWIVVGGGFDNPPAPWAILDAANGASIGTVTVAGDPIDDTRPRQRPSSPPYTTRFAVSADGLRLISSHYDGSTRVWETSTWKQVGRLETHRRMTGVVALSPDGKWLAAANQANAAIWELSSGKKVVDFTGQHSNITQVAFTFDGKGLLTNADLSPVLWDLRPKDITKLDGTDDARWELLKSDDGAAVYRLQWALIQESKLAVELASKRIQPADWAMDRATVEKWVNDLDSARFAVREKAEKDVLAAGVKVPLAWLRQGLTAAPSEEARTRLARVITKRESEPDREAIRLGRLTQILERAGTAEAKELLKKWATGTEGTLPQVEAKGALARVR